MYHENCSLAADRSKAHVTAPKFTALRSLMEYIRWIDLLHVTHRLPSAPSHPLILWRALSRELILRNAVSFDGSFHV